MGGQGFDREILVEEDVEEQLGENLERGDGMVEEKRRILVVFPLLRK